MPEEKSNVHDQDFGLRKPDVTFLPGAGFAGMERFHLLPEQRDEVLTVARQDGVATERDIGLELRRFDDRQGDDVRPGAGGQGELVDHRDAEPTSDQGAHHGAEARLDRDLVGEAEAREDAGHDAAVGIVGIDADQRMAHDVGSRDAALARQRMGLGHDAEQPALGQRLEGHHRMVEARAHGDGLALAQQDVVERLLELQHVHVDQQVGEALAHALDGARHHDVGDAGHRADPELGVRALREAADDVLQVADLVVDGVDLVEDVARLGARRVAAVAAAEQFQAERWSRHASSRG